MPFNPTNLLLSSTSRPIDQQTLPLGPDWIPVLENPCDFDSDTFFEVLLNLIRNPNINSSHLFRADILHDSREDEVADKVLPADELQRLQDEAALQASALPSYRIRRTLIRQLIPRNPQLDKPIAQTCHLLQSIDSSGATQSLVLLIPHVAGLEDLPWYHPTVQSLAYLHTRRLSSCLTSLPNGSNPGLESGENQSLVSLHFRLFPNQELPLSSRLTRTANNLLGTLYKHGQGNLGGYIKKVHHDQLVSQKRVQDTYTELKRIHAKRLCDNWVEKTEPSKHVFEDLGIAAFLIELWKDMYLPPPTQNLNCAGLPADLLAFPGFVDIGCGNGVLTEVLLLSGYSGWGFDARRRKTWSHLSKKTQQNLHELLLVPQPLYDITTPVKPSKPLLNRALSFLSSQKTPASSLTPPSKPHHNGIFPKGTFIISNHADELTAWTPLLASLSYSPFLAIPCCSHNLSGTRFRAPSTANSQTADLLAPSFFAAQKPKANAKHVPISIPMYLDADTEQDMESKPLPSSTSTFHSEQNGKPVGSPPKSIPSPQFSHPTAQAASPTSSTMPLESPPTNILPPRVPPAESGSLHTLSPSARAKQPSAYASLCQWVSHLASEVGFVPEREMLRIPSTRNVGLVGRVLVDGEEEMGDKERWERVKGVARKEGADGAKWVQRCESVLAKEGGAGGEHG